MTFGSSSHRVFEVPELLGFICKFSSNQGRVTLLRVSRLFFNVTAPIIWQNVAGAHHLLKLLPGIEVTTEMAGRLSVVIPEYQEEATNFERFDCYAPFVKHLEITPSNVTHYQVRGWRPLSEKAKHRVLLPNLLQLTLASVPMPSHDQFLWIRTFLSPSLNAILVNADIYESLPTITCLVASSLLGHIVKLCPKLEQLQLFPSVTRSNVPDSNGYTVADFWESSFYDRLGGLQLRKLGCTTEILSPDWIHVLATLPVLESLVVHSVSCTIASSRPAPFPSLKEFAVHKTELKEFQDLGALGLLRGLSSLEISFGDFAFPRFQGGAIDCWEAEFLSLICNNNQELSKLNIDFGGMEFKLHPSTPLHLMTALPLTHVRLKGLTGSTDATLRDLPLVWPKVSVLEIHDLDEAYSFDELLHFSKFPHLEHLVVDLVGDTKCLPPIPPTISPNVLRVLEITGDFDLGLDLGQDLSSVAQYLVSLWPRLQRVTWPGLVGTTPYTYHEVPLINALNSLVVFHHDMNRLRSRIIEEYGVTALDRLLR